MEQSLQEIQNEKKSVTKQLSKCIDNETAIKKDYKELNLKYEKLLENIIPRINSVLEVCKNTDKEFRVCKQEYYKCSSEINKIKDYVKEELVVKYNKEGCKDSCYPSDFQECIDDLLPNQEVIVSGMDE